MSFEERKVNVGIAGPGIVGSEVVRAFEAGRFIPHGIILRAIAARDPSKVRNIPFPEGVRVTDNAQTIIDDPEIDIFVETIGGNKEARHFNFRALEGRKHLVLANKDFLGENLAEIHDIAREKGVSVSYEASVLGTIPILGLLRDYYRIQDIKSLRGIVNGTSNYILTKIAEGLDPKIALKEAQNLGYAESDPTRDLDGSDAVSKLAILVSLASGTHIKPENILRRGITGVMTDDMTFAAQFGVPEGGKGYAVKLLASAEQFDGRWSVQVAPTLISRTHPLASIDGVTNAITVESNLSHFITYSGAGAGGEPTSAAIDSDILHAADHVRFSTPDFLPELSRNPSIIRPEEIMTRGYIRTELLDKIGTIIRLGRILADCGLSAESLLQRAVARDIDGKPYSKDIITLHAAPQGQINKALKMLARSSKVHGEPFYMQFAD